jgi:hypothetical protein
MHGYSIHLLDMLAHEINILWAPIYSWPRRSKGPWRSHVSWQAILGLEGEETLPTPRWCREVVWDSSYHRTWSGRVQNFSGSQEDAATSSVGTQWFPSRWTLPRRSQQWVNHLLDTREEAPAWDQPSLATWVRKKDEVVRCWYLIRTIRPPRHGAAREELAVHGEDTDRAAQGVTHRNSQFWNMTKIH